MPRSSLLRVFGCKMCRRVIARDLAVRKQGLDFEVAKGLRACASGDSFDPWRTDLGSPKAFTHLI